MVSRLQYSGINRIGNLEIILVLSTFPVLELVPPGGPLSEGNRAVTESCDKANAARGRGCARMRAFLFYRLAVVISFVSRGRQQRSSNTPHRERYTNILSLHTRAQARPTLTPLAHIN